MPIVPELRQGISIDVPGAPDAMRGAGIVEGAVSNLGAQLAKTSLGILDEIKKSEALTSTMAKKQEALFADEDLKAQIKRTSANGYMQNPDKTIMTNKDGMVTTAQFYRDQTNERFKNDQLALPSRMAQTLYQQEMTPYYGDSIRKMELNQWEENVAGQKNTFMNGLLQAHNRLQDTPSMELGSSLLDTQKKYMLDNRAKMAPDGKVSGLFSEKDIRDSDALINAQITDGHFSGRITQAGSASPSDRSDLIKLALAELEGKDAVSERRKKAGLPVFSDIIPVGKKDDYKKQLLHMQKTNGAYVANEFSGVLSNQIAAAQSGKAVDWSALTRSGNALLDSSQSQEHLKHNQSVYSEGLTSVISAVSEKKTSDNYRVTNPNQWSFYDQRFDSTLDADIRDAANRFPEISTAYDKNAGEVTRRRAKINLEIQKEQIIKERNGDAAAYTQKTFPSVGAKFLGAGNNPAGIQGAIDLSIAKQEELGIPTQFRRVISKFQAVEDVKPLNSSDPNAVLAGAEAIKNKYGKHADKVIQTYGKDGLVDDVKLLSVIMTSNDPETKRSAAVNFARGDEIRKQFNESFTDVDKQNLSKYVNEVNEDLMIPDYDGTYAEQNNATREMLLREAQKAKTANPSLSAKEAAEIGRKNLDGDHDVFRVGSSIIRSPKTIGDEHVNPKVVRAFLSSRNKPNAMEAMDIAIPSTLANDPSWAARPENEKKALFFRDIRERGKFLKNDEFSVRWVIIGRDQKTYPIRHKDGSPVIFNFSDMQKIDDFTREELSPGWISRIGDALLNVVQEGVRPK